MTFDSRYRTPYHCCMNNGPKGYSVYMHLNPKTQIPFYIGCGDFKRPYDFNVRNDLWLEHYSKHGVKVIIVGYFKHKKQGDALEQRLIKEHKATVINIYSTEGLRRKSTYKKR